MSEDTMGTEKEANQDINETQDITAEQKASADLPISDLTEHTPPFIRIPNLLRRADIRDSREKSAADGFAAEVDFYQRTRAIAETFLDTPLSDPNPKQYYDPEQLRGAYETASGETKKVIRSRVRQQVENRKRDVFTSLKRDISVLYMDQGFSDDEIDQRIESISAVTVGNKKRELDQLPTNTQIGILENMSELRMKLFADNFDQYMYLLSFSNPMPMTATLEQSNEEVRYEFSSSDLRRKATIAAEKRDKAEKGLERTFEANIPRLEQIELDHGGFRMPDIKREASELRSQFQQATLSKKGEIVRVMQEKKLNLSVGQLASITNLRRKIERDFDIAKIVTGQITDQQRLEEEVDRILFLLTFTMLKRDTAQDSELGIEDLEKSVRNLSKLYEDPSLNESLKKALQIRLSPDDYFKL